MTSASVGDDVSDNLDLWDYRRRVADLYAAARAGGPGEETWSKWVRDRDDLFRTHPQTALDDPSRLGGLPYFPYDARWRTVARFSETDIVQWGEFQRIGRLDFELRGQKAWLPVFWLAAYGGGIFVPFRDGTNARTTYGGGRYILDTVKGADLGHEGSSVVLDFNYAYHPSCVHSPRWNCPLAPPESSLELEVEAGEQLSEAPSGR